MKNFLVYSLIFVATFMTFARGTEAFTIDEKAASFPSKAEGRQGLYELNSVYPNLTTITIDTDSDEVSGLVLSGQFPALQSVDVSGNAQNFSGKLTGAFPVLDMIDISSTSADCRLDLTGEFQQNVKVTLRSTSGNIRLRLPKKIGFRVTVVSTSGEVYTALPQTGGWFSKKIFESHAFRTSKIGLDIRIDVTSGNVYLN